MNIPLLTHLQALDDDTLAHLLDRANTLADGVVAKPALSGATVANLFYEPSTRTRASFEIAARRLGAQVLNLDITRSSTVKGETLLDTVRTLHAMGIAYFVVRHGGHGILSELAGALKGSRLAVVSAGEGRDGHPTQALIDLLTLQRTFGELKGLDIAVVGDISHSRVARSVIPALTRLGAVVRIAGPDALMPEKDEFPGTTRVRNLAEAIAGASAVMALRVQRERIHGSDAPTEADYAARWGLNEERLAEHAPQAKILHPGPFNRGVELTSEVADGPRSLILTQVANGVAVRAAVLEWLARELENG